MVEFRLIKCLILNGLLTGNRLNNSWLRILFPILQVGIGTRGEVGCHKKGIGEVKVYIWEKKYGGHGVSGWRRLKKLEGENYQLQKLMAVHSLDKQI